MDLKNFLLCFDDLISWNYEKYYFIIIIIVYVLILLIEFTWQIIFQFKLISF